MKLSQESRFMEKHREKINFIVRFFGLLALVALGYPLVVMFLCMGP